MGILYYNLFFFVCFWISVFSFAIRRSTPNSLIALPHSHHHALAVSSPSNHDISFRVLDDRLATSLWFLFDRMMLMISTTPLTVLLSMKWSIVTKYGLYCHRRHGIGRWRASEIEIHTDDDARLLPSLWLVSLPRWSWETERYENTESEFWSIRREPLPDRMVVSTCVLYYSMLTRLFYGWQTLLTRATHL